jgi:hypothetical protein
LPAFVVAVFRDIPAMLFVCGNVEQWTRGREWSLAIWERNFALWIPHLVRASARTPPTTWSTVFSLVGDFGSKRWQPVAITVAKPGYS